MYIKIATVSFLLVLFSNNLSCLASEQPSSFEDVRCKCVCPKYQDKNNTLPDRTVYISDNVNPRLCKCEYVVKSATPELCPRCECKYESRNTTTIKVVVVFVICIVSLLFVYMLFLLCLDPLIAHRPPRYEEHTNEEVNLDDQTVRRVPQQPKRRPVRQMSIIDHVKDEQKKWKGTVSEQRKNIYDRHAMLN
ncbi:hypothetical protein ScPMuIL_012744 [Solemya velum]